jgi:nitrite reductase/ring-hydroxylating ferredoxin subunit
MDDDNVYVVSGDSGTGMTHGTIAGMLITDLIRGRDNPWTQLYSPSRKSLRTLPTFLKENANVAWQYRDWLKGSQVPSEDAIAPDQGGVIVDGVHHLAVYCDASGQKHRCSAVCPHLGGIVRWNAGEKTWDCPCHGSRFDRFGKVLNGPAASDLKPIQHPPLVQEPEPWSPATTRNPGRTAEPQTLAAAIPPTAGRSASHSSAPAISPSTPSSQPSATPGPTAS